MRFFPYSEPYENQREAIERIATAFSRNQDVLFEGACGTGKTLSALAPALATARSQDKTVVITTNVHQQMRQFVEEARAIAETTPLRAAVFRGKASMCHIDVGYDECQVLRDNTRDLVEVEGEIRELEGREQELLAEAQAGNDEATGARAIVANELEELDQEREDLADRPTCEHFYRNLTGDVDEFYRWLHADVRRPDEIYEYADGNGFCGYELLKDGLDAVDLVVCNYYHLLDPMIRTQFFRWLGRDADEIITIFDEAHNIEDAAREHATRTLTEGTLEAALGELEEVSDHRVARAEALFVPFLETMRDVYLSRLDRTETVGEDWIDLNIDERDGPDELTRGLREADVDDLEDVVEAALALGGDLEATYEDAYRRGETDVRRESQVLQVAWFLQGWIDAADDHRFLPVLSIRRDDRTDEIYGRAELFACVPRDIAGELFGQVAASVLMSATLRPFSVVQDALGLEDPVELAYGLTFPADHRRTFAVDSPALFSRDRGDPQVQAEVAAVLGDAIRMTPGNTLVYFPSYAEAARYHDRLGHLEATRYLDEPATRAEGLRQEFTADDHAALFTSIWGTLTEGVSFDGDDAQTVVVVGVPYPYLDDRTQAVRDAYAIEYGDGDPTAGWRYAVEIPTIRKTRQALGRVLRSPEDIGVRVLLDKRYTAAATQEMGKYSVRETFPPEERAELIDVESDRLRFSMLNFYTDHDAYEGGPPSPERPD